MVTRDHDSKPRGDGYDHAVVRRAHARTSPLDPDWLLQRHLVRDLARALATSARGRLLDVGCGRRPYESFVPDTATYFGVDTSSRAGSCPDACGVATMLPFADGAFTTVLCTQVLEHVPDPADALAEIARVLSPGGRVILTAPQAWFVHEAPFDFHRFTRHGLEHLCRRAGLAPIDVRSQGGFWATVGIFFSVHLGSYVQWFAERRPSLPAADARPPGWRRVLWPLRLPMAIFNLVFGALDALPHPGIFSVNHLVIAEKLPSPGLPDVPQRAP